MTEADILREVKRLVAETCALDRAAIRDEGRLSDYGIDSVRAIDLLVSLEETFQIAVPDADAARLATIGDVVGYVARRRTGGGTKA